MKNILKKLQPTDRLNLRTEGGMVEATILVVLIVISTLVALNSVGTKVQVSLLSSTGIMQQQSFTDGRNSQGPDFDSENDFTAGGGTEEVSPDDQGHNNENDDGYNNG